MYIQAQNMPKYQITQEESFEFQKSVKNELKELEGYFFSSESWDSILSKYVRGTAGGLGEALF